MGFKAHQENRAKQFQPFAALKGYPEALYEKEKIIVTKSELSEEFQEKLDWKLQQIQKNDIISVVYFYQNDYRTITGMVTKIDTTFKNIMIENTKISFTDIYDMDI